MQTFLSPYIHHTIQKWAWDLWGIMSLLWPNKTAAHLCLWNLESYKSEGLDKYQTSSPPRPILDYFLKAFTSFMFQAVPQKSQPWPAEGDSLPTAGGYVTQGPITNCWTSKNSGSSRVLLTQGLQNRSAEEISRYLCICLKSTVRQIRGIVLILHF